MLRVYVMMDDDYRWTRGGMITCIFWDSFVEFEWNTFLRRTYRAG